MLKRTHTCGELTLDHVGQTVILNGWVDAWRDFGGLVFIDVRDRYGAHPGRLRARGRRRAPGRRARAAQRVRHRHPGGRRAAAAGQGEPQAQDRRDRGPGQALEVFNATPTPPFEIQGAEANEELRLKYRYLDLRRPAMQEVFVLRHRMAQLMRNTMSDQGFLEVETPILGRSTPEGARDFLVPSRVHAGPLLRAAAVAAALQAAPDGRRASTATSRSPAASATRTSAPTASPSSPSSTSRCRSSRTRTS